MANQKYSKEELCAEIKRIYEEHGIMNTVILKKYNTLSISINGQLHYYGGLIFLCEELNIPYTNAHKNNKEDMIKDIMTVFQEHNEDGRLTSRIYEQYGKYSRTGISGIFGSFNNMLKELNLPVNVNTKITKDDIKINVLNFYKKYNTTSTNEYRKNGKYSQCAITRLFGSWKNLMEELNLPYLGETYGYDEIMRQVRNVYDRYGFISKELIDDECNFSYQAIGFYLKNKEDISKAIGVENAFCDTNSAKAKLTQKILVLLFGKDNVITEKTWDWLINPKTNKHLNVDFYIPLINCAIEYDGGQHDEFVEKFHKDINGFKESKYRDEIKNKLIKEHNIHLIRIKEHEKITLQNINMKILAVLGITK